MTKILAISSQVACGSVGLSIIAPALQALGHEVIALPTVVLSNHPGHPHVAGTHIDPDVLDKMLDALEANGWLANLDAILTGYLPTLTHVDFAVHAVDRVKAIRSNRCLYLCDPVMGDDPKGLYIDQTAAQAIKHGLLPMADISTPNRFELSFLTGTNIRREADITNKAWKYAALVATSIPGDDPQTTCNVLVSSTSRSQTRVPLRTGAPHGTGDLFSALVLSAMLNGEPLQQALALATADVDATLAGSVGCDQLRLQALPAKDRRSHPWAVEPIR